MIVEEENMAEKRRLVVVITGAAGFLGKAIIRLINERCSQEVKIIRGFDSSPVRPVHSVCQDSGEESDQSQRDSGRDRIQAKTKSSVPIEDYQGDVRDYSKVRQNYA